MVETARYQKVAVNDPCDSSTIGCKDTTHKLAPLLRVFQGLYNMAGHQRRVRDHPVSSARSNAQYRAFIIPPDQVFAVPEVRSTNCRQLNRLQNHEQSDDSVSDQACTRCRERKIRCGRELPQCNNCERDESVTCTYQNPTKRVNHLKSL